ncbi:hypothetical protein FJY94_01465 [Candidatus Kaiserbacteria bacterium]|nr:hypothetical protein [Candidatus Kaiserbacteria bacterium]
MSDAAQVPMSTLLLNVKAAHNHAHALEASLAKSREILAGHESALRDAIAAGAKTGDPMLDLTMRCHHYDPVLVEKFRELDAELKGKTGEFVLVVFETRVMTCHRFLGPNDYENRTMFRMALLRGESLIWHERNYVTVPSERYITGDVAMMFGDSDPRIEMCDGDLFARMYRNDPEILGILVLKDLWRERLYVGDEAVKAFLKEKHMLPLFNAAAEALGRLILQPTDENCS